MNRHEHSMACRLLACGLVLPGTLVAADWERHPVLEDDWRISVGEFFQTADSKLTVAAEYTGASGPEIDFEEAMGLSKRDSRASGQMLWRFGDKWSFALQYMDRKDAASAEVAQDLPWEGTVVPAGVEATGGVSSKVYRLFFGRRFSAGPNYEFGAGLGVHWLEMGAFIEGEFFLDGSSQGFERRTVSASAPLPNIGAWYTWAWSRRWAAMIRLDYFSANFGSYSGSLTNAAAGLLLQVSRHVALGFDYNFFELDVGVDAQGWNGAADFVRDGPFVHVTFNW